MVEVLLFVFLSFLLSLFIQMWNLLSLIARTLLLVDEYGSKETRVKLPRLMPPPMILISSYFSLIICKSALLYLSSFEISSHLPFLGFVDVRPIITFLPLLNLGLSINLPLITTIFLFLHSFPIDPHLPEPHNGTSSFSNDSLRALSLLVLLHSPRVLVEVFTRTFMVKALALSHYKMLPNKYIEFETLPFISTMKSHMIFK